MGITKKLWGQLNGQDVYLFTISNGKLELSITNFGCTIVSINLPGIDGTPCNMVLGYDTLDGYINDPYYMGCIVGRFANRVSNAQFQIGKKIYQLEANEADTGNHLHGGQRGFHKRVFSIPVLDDDIAPDTIQFYYRSPDGEEGYPGNLDVFVTYTLSEKNEIIIQYKASTDKITPVNLTSHCYFNLSGSMTSATAHELMIHSGRVLEAGINHIPTGTIKPVSGSNFDFRDYRSIDNGQPSFPGYNDFFILDPAMGDMDINAVLRLPGTPRTMIVKTTLPGILFYTGDYLAAPFLKNQGICLETQFFPDSPNQPKFPSTLLYPGNLYNHKTIYQFN